MAQKDSRVKTKDNGVQELIIDVVVPAGANPSVATVYTRPFAAVPRIKGLVRVDGNTAENFVPQISANLATGFTIRFAGTLTVEHTYQVTVIGDYNNGTAY